MRDPRTGWLIGAGAVSLAFLLLSRNKCKPASDVDALAQMLITETGFLGDKNEMAQIVFVALNRAKRWGVPVSQVVYPPGSPGVWNGSSVYRSRFCAAPDNPRWEAARAFVKTVLAGSYQNLGKTMFVHPGGMPQPPCSDNRTVASTIAGARCLPAWALNGQVVGKAMFV